MDGDTAHFDLPGAGGSARVRFLFVDAEEVQGPRATALGAQASRRVAGWLRGASRLAVWLREDGQRPGHPETDAYGRWLGLVFADGALVQERLVRGGLSVYFTAFGCAPEPWHRRMLRAEAVARREERGVWRRGRWPDYRKDVAAWLGRSGCRREPFRADGGR